MPRLPLPKQKKCEQTKKSRENILINKQFVLKEEVQLKSNNNNINSTIGMGTGLKEKRVALNEEDVEFFLNEEINFEEYEVVNSSMIARERKKLGNSIKKIIL